VHNSYYFKLVIKVIKNEIPVAGYMYQIIAGLLLFNVLSITMLITGFELE